jgi:hypothetical protein
MRCCGGRRIAFLDRESLNATCVKKSGWSARANVAVRFAAMVKQKEEEARTGSLSDLTTPGSND